MSLSVGIVGLPNVGKSTLFNALLKKQQAYVANFPFATIEPNIGIVPVPDSRLEQLALTINHQSSIAHTLEFYPEEGKYHYTGHRACGIKYDPQEAVKKGTVCPVCHRNLTQGVMQRVEELADRTEESLLLSVISTPPAVAFGDSRWRAGRLSVSSESVVSQPVSETGKPKTGKLESENRRPKTVRRSSFPQAAFSRTGARDPTSGFRIRRR